MTFEIFNDPNHFDMWCVRKLGDKDFNMTVHVMSDSQAEHNKLVIEEWVKQGQREALLEAADKFLKLDFTEQDFEGQWASGWLLKMAEEIK